PDLRERLARLRRLAALDLAELDLADDGSRDGREGPAHHEAHQRQHQRGDRHRAGALRWAAHRRPEPTSRRLTEGAGRAARRTEASAARGPEPSTARRAKTTTRRAATRWRAEPTATRRLTKACHRISSSSLARLARSIMFLRERIVSCSPAARTAVSLQPPRDACLP